MTRQRKTYSEELVRLRTGREIPDLLRDLYIDKRHSQQEIADALGVGRFLVVQWLREYGISREDRPPVVIEAIA